VLLLGELVSTGVQPFSPARHHLHRRCPRAGAGRVGRCHCGACASGQFWALRKALLFPKTLSVQTVLQWEQRPLQGYPSPIGEASLAGHGEQWPSQCCQSLGRCWWHQQGCVAVP